MLVRKVTTDARTGAVIEEWVEDPNAITVEAGQAKMQQAALLDTNRLTLEQKADQYMADSAAFLALASPTNAQTLAQVKQNTRAIRGLVRLIRRKFDATD